MVSLWCLCWSRLAQHMACRGICTPKDLLERPEPLPEGARARFSKDCNLCDTSYSRSTALWSAGKVAASAPMSAYVATSGYDRR